MILNWNGRKLLHNCLTSLEKTTYQALKILVVDNGSSDGSAELVSHEFPNVDVLRLPNNTGFAKGNNIGIRHALRTYDPDYVVLLSNDTVVIQADWLEHMVRVAESDPLIGMVNCRYLLPDGKPQPMGFRLIPGLYLSGTFGIHLLGAQNQEQSALITLTDSAGGACFLIKRSVLDRIGLLDEGYSPVYFEDVDFGIRAMKANFKLAHDGRVSIIHIGSATAKKLSDSYMTFVYRKNFFRFVRKHHPLALPFVVLMVLLNSPFRALRSALVFNHPARFGTFLSADVMATAQAIRAWFRRQSR